MLGSNSYNPPWYFRNGLLQTVLASSPLRAWGYNPMREAARERIIETPEGIRLQGYLSSHITNEAAGLVILLHGWEGSANSTYITCTARTLFRHGYDIFRLNFRDHGDSHHLNPGIFYAVLLEEVRQAVGHISHLAQKMPVFMVGFSLGGNFALRIARALSDAPIDNLRHVVAVSPVLDPAKATERIDRQPLIRRYFLKKWLRSLRIKQQLFPDQYDFSELFDLPTIQAVTDRMLDKYSDYQSSADYFKDYSILNDAIADLPVPTTILTASDDPVIPVEDFFGLKLDHRSRLVIHDHGGHNGFINGFLLKSWYEDQLVKMFDEIVNRLEGQEA